MFCKNFKEKPLGPQMLLYFTLISFKGAVQICLMEDLDIQCYIFRQIKIATAILDSYI